MSKREIQEKELKAVLAKDVATKNPVFSPEHITELHALFSIYADPRQRRADVRDMMITASTLGLDAKYELVFRVLQELYDTTNGAPLDFEQFLRELTNRIVLFTPLRATPSARKAGRLTLPSWTSRPRESWTSTICVTSTSSWSTATTTTSWSRSSIRLVATELRLLPGTGSTNSSRRRSTRENSVSDCHSIYAH